jgi:hypothetical protein
MSDKITLNFKLSTSSTNYRLLEVTGIPDEIKCLSEKQFSVKMGLKLEQSSV